LSKQIGLLRTDGRSLCANGLHAAAVVLVCIDKRGYPYSAAASQCFCRGGSWSGSGEAQKEMANMPRGGTLLMQMKPDNMIKFVAIPLAGA